MRAKARRLALHFMHRLFRRALLAFCVMPGPLIAGPAILSAAYEGPTTRYAHDVLGDPIEHSDLLLELSDGTSRRFVLPDRLVFEDTEPRIVDLDFDGDQEVIVVESSQTQGARLAVYGLEGRITMTPFIGTRFRWLAPVGAADLDGDGQMEIAYIDRPHLAKTLRLWRYTDQKLTHVADLAGLTNHRIGERDIAGGTRICAAAPQMILATADWSQLVAVSFQGGQFKINDLGRDTTRPAFAQALACNP